MGSIVFADACYAGLLHQKDGNFGVSAKRLVSWDGNFCINLFVSLLSTINS